MPAAALAPFYATPAARLNLRARAGLGLACLGAAGAPLAARWIPDLTARLICGVLIAAGLLALCLACARLAPLRQFRALACALFIFAVVQVLNNTIPHYVATYVLGESPTDANPLASTVSGSVVIQLVETAVAILVLARLTGLDLASLYLRQRPGGRWLLGSIAVFVAVYALIATSPLRPGSPIQQVLPTGANLTFQRVLALTPALLVMALSNGFQEELLFRGLFLQRYTPFFGPGLANVLQAAVFTVAHVNVSYTPMLLVFLVAVVFPLGLLGGFLMRASRGVVVPSILHGAFDIQIYLGFLASVP
ncbi:MAG TPA: CPBP family intramembrane glutamic endopeptidase [Chloroflexota bacterium]|nr:CPBP family intramembrane glutamic endopeptidase [Chloroflexota bacterium]